MNLSESQVKGGLERVTDELIVVIPEDQLDQIGGGIQNPLHRG